MKLQRYILFACLLNPMLTLAQPGDLPLSDDIGSPRIRGSVTVNESQVYTLRGGGYNIWYNRDEFFFAHQWLRGDFILTANMAFTDTSGHPHRKMGWMVRAGKDASAQHVSAVLHGDGLNGMQWRLLRGAYMRDPEDEIRFPKKKVQTVQLERKGRLFIMRLAAWGEPLQEVGRKEIAGMPDSVMAGIFACSHDEDKAVTVKAWNVRVAREGSGGERVTSRLEYVDITDGRRQLVYQASERFEAPNYMPDGKQLLFNQGGYLYTLPEAGGVPGRFNTGSATKNNNDHGISFDGRQVALSSHRDGLPGYGSTIYTVPITGGEPRMVSEKTPNYWHGWSPDGKYVLAIGQRGGPVYNVYKISVADGSETDLTGNKSGHVDGAEYSRDGKWIYFNWNVTGTMQIWRMKPDGTQKEQVSFDEYNNWFPHMSPDGKWICIISFPADINPDEHPADKRVMLRLMPVSGGAPRVLAHLYGGQGTINVPSWSPDSRKVAFVSYTY
jgi:TolB protein